MISAQDIQRNLQLLREDADAPTHDENMVDSNIDDEDAANSEIEVITSSPATAPHGEVKQQDDSGTDGEGDTTKLVTDNETGPKRTSSFQGNDPLLGIAVGAKGVSQQRRPEDASEEEEVESEPEESLLHVSDMAHASDVFLDEPSVSEVDKSNPMPFFGPPGSGMPATSSTQGEEKESVMVSAEEIMPQNNLSNFFETLPANQGMMTKPQLLELWEHYRFNQQPVDVMELNEMTVLIDHFIKKAESWAEHIRHEVPSTEEKKAVRKFQSKLKKLNRGKLAAKMFKRIDSGGNGQIGLADFLSRFNDQLLRLTEKDIPMPPVIVRKKKHHKKHAPGRRPRPHGTEEMKESEVNGTGKSPGRRLNPSRRQQEKEAAEKAKKKKKKKSKHSKEHDPTAPSVSFTAKLTLPKMTSGVKHRLTQMDTYDEVNPDPPEKPL